MSNTEILHPRRFDRTNAVIAAAVWLFTLTLYAITTAPTLSFWDCGEFIAVSSILGVPHPPGSPLYVLLGRLFSLLPIVSDPAMRVNLLSGVSSAFAAMFGYLVVVRLLRSWFTETDWTSRLIVYGGSISGALFGAFNLVNWNNSVEAEVYGLTMVIMLAVFWLGLVYRDHQGTPKGDRLMFLAVFLAVLGVGVHMMAFIALPIVALLFMLKKDSPTWVWYAVGLFFVTELYLIFALSSRPGEIPFYIPVTIAAAFFFLYVFSFEDIPRIHLWVGLGFLIAMLPLYGVLLQRVTSIGGAAGMLNAGGLLAFSGLIIAAVYLVKIFFDHRHTENAARTWLAPAGFITAAVIMFGLLHIFKGYKPFLLVSAIAAILLAWLIRRYIRWDILIAILAVSLIIVEVKPFLFAVALAAVVLTMLGLARVLPEWKAALLILAVAVAGFSINVFIPVRASQEPAINENNPQTISATIDFLDRKQYGQVSMVERMFVRRGSWENQFGGYQRMGFWRFFHEQYGARGPASVFFVLAGLFGAWEVLRRRPRAGLILVLLLLLTSIGLVLYMNFADGTRQHPTTGQDYLEVRDRDYFWTSAFVLFGLSIGIGLAFLVGALRDSLRDRPAIRMPIVAASMLLFATPIVAITGNYHLTDRAGNYIPYDYGMNLLNSAEPNSIIFTYGDNDTFPLWCLHQTYGNRTDALVVNLSLANTNWYVRQLRSTMGLELPWTDAEIDQLRPHRTSDGTVYRLQDMVIDALIDRYYGERPIYFSVTVGSGVRRYRGQPIDSRLTMTGMLFRVGEPHGRLNVDVETSLDFFQNQFLARGVADPDVYKDEATERLTRNYGNSFLMVADTLRKAGDVATSEKLVAGAWKLIPYAGDLPEYLASVYEQQGRVDDLQRLVDTCAYGDLNWMRTLLGLAQVRQGDTASGRSTLEEIIRSTHDYRRALDELMRMDYGTRDVNGMKRSLQLWLEFNPNDQQIKSALRELEAGINFDDLTRETRR